jgi:hypothetical protein
MRWWSTDGTDRSGLSRRIGTCDFAASATRDVFPACSPAAGAVPPARARSCPFSPAVASGAGSF